MAELAPGTLFAGCRIEAVAGRGGMGVVYRATQLDLGRQVAIKLVAPDRAAEAEFRRRFQREARMTAAIDHPNVIPVYAAGEENGHLFLVMRWVDGIDLQALIAREGRLAGARAAGLVAQVAAGLDAAHAEGLIHRDVKPANVLLARGGHAYLTDFGIGRVMTAETVITDSGRWVGTADFMSPEHLRGDRTDPRSDVYALGCLLYAALTGTPPFRRETVPATVTAHLHAPPPLPSEAGAPAAFDAVIARALAKNPADRHQSASALGDAAQRAAEGNGGGMMARLGALARGGGVAVAPAPAAVAAAPPQAPAPAHAPAPPAGPRLRTAVTKLLGTSRGAAPRPTALDLRDRRPQAPPAPPREKRRKHRKQQEEPKRRRLRRARRPEPPPPPPPPRKRRRLRRALIGITAAAGLGAAGAGVVALASAGDGAKPPRTGPLTVTEVERIANSFARAYAREDAGALRRLLTARAQRVSTDGDQHGRNEVVAEYRSQFERNETSDYRLRDLSATGGRVGRASSTYVVTRDGRPPITGRLVLAVVRERGRPRIELIAAEPRS